jgi:fructokinase
MPGALKTILCFGETLWDLLPSGPVLGGAPFNVMCRLHSLGDRSRIATRLGRDDYGTRARGSIAAMDLDLALVQPDDARPTGTVKVTVDARGNPDFVIIPDAAYDFIEATDELIEAGEAADCVCFGTLAQRAPVSRRTLHQLLDASARSLKFFDLNLRKDCYSFATITESLRRANILKLNLPEAHYVAELFQLSIASLPDFCVEVLEDWSLDCVLVTLGEHGAFAARANGEKVYVPGRETTVVDTCGAGDAFSAGFIHAHLQGQTLGPSCRLANLLGALTATQSGATAPISRSDLERFIGLRHRFVREPRLARYSIL